jgi:DNA-binding NarL/FixJ family response regulator
MSTQLHNAATWPRSVRQHIESIAATLMLGLQVFRERAMNLGGSLAAIVTSDAKDEKIRSLEVELELHRRRFSRIPAKSRPHFSPEDRLVVLRLAWRNGWSAQDVAQRLLLNVSTVRRWMRM